MIILGGVSINLKGQRHSKSIKKITRLQRVYKFIHALLLFVNFVQIELYPNLLFFMAVEKFPDNIPEFKRESDVAGWNYFIKDSLKEFLEEKT